MATKKTVAVSPHWDKVFVIGGEPCMARLFLGTTVEDLGGGRVRYLNKEHKGEAVNKALAGFTLRQPADIIAINNPNAEQLKACLEVVTQSTRFTARGLLLLVSGDQLDARMAFAKAALKYKRTFYFPYLLQGDTAGLKRHLQEWQEGVAVRFEPDALKWLVQHAPTTTIKVKDGSTKKEATAYDLLILEQELSKPLSLRLHEGGTISLDDVIQLCVFEQVDDVWELVRHALNGDAARTLQLMDQMEIGNGSQGALWLLSSQLSLLIKLKSTIKVVNTTNVDIIIQRMSLEPFLGCYLANDWQELAHVPSAPALNPWRIRKALESSTHWSLEQLTQQHMAVNSALRDLRYGVDGELVLPYLALALAGKVAYTQPMLTTA